MIHYVALLGLPQFAPQVRHRRPRATDDVEFSAAPPYICAASLMDSALAMGRWGRALAMLLQRSHWGVADSPQPRGPVDILAHASLGNDNGKWTETRPRQPRSSGFNHAGIGRLLRASPLASRHLRLSRKKTCVDAVYLIWGFHGQSWR
jgi:hypothetical protein